MCRLVTTTEVHGDLDIIEHIIFHANLRSKNLKFLCATGLTCCMSNDDITPYTA